MQWIIIQVPLLQRKGFRYYLKIHLRKRSNGSFSASPEGGFTLPQPKVDTIGKNCQKHTNSIDSCFIVFRGPTAHDTITDFICCQWSGVLWPPFLRDYHKTFCSWRLSQFFLWKTGTIKDTLWEFLQHGGFNSTTIPQTTKIKWMTDGGVAPAIHKLAFTGCPVTPSLIQFSVYWHQSVIQKCWLYRTNYVYNSLQY